MNSRSYLALPLLAVALLPACRATEPAPSSVADVTAEAAPAELPEIRYYVIADT